MAETLTSIKADPHTPPCDDHTDPLSIPMSQFTGVTAINTEKEEEQEHSLDQGVNNAQTNFQNISMYILMQE